MVVTVSFMEKKFQGNTDLPFGKQIPVPLTTGLVAHASAATAAPQITDPAIT
ncbi:MAG TPA: hypothetical protein VFX64_02050 [Candidatus Nitrosotalea sp.]|nr:hypothetical protein [Candidatus Nitrosotalea sp.]